MIMKRKLVLLIVFLYLFSFFAGCGSNDNTKPVALNDETLEDDFSSFDQYVSSFESAITENESSVHSETSHLNSSSQSVSSKVTSSKENSSKVSSSVSSVVSSDKTTGEETEEAISLSDLQEIQKSEYYCYNKLTNVQKKAYDAIYEMVRDYKSGDKIINGASSMDISVAYNAVHLDNPQFFWMGSAYYILTETKGDKVSYGIRMNPDGKGYITNGIADRDQKQKALNDFVDSVILSVIKKNMSKMEMAKAVHDYICEKTSYNYNYTTEDKDKYNWTAYGALIEKKAVCEGYSRAFQLILYKLGIKNTLISGTANNGEHMWNVINVGGWKTIDVTWDDKKDGTFDYKYYGKTSINPSSNHKAYPVLSKATEDNILIGKYNLFDGLK